MERSDWVKTVYLAACRVAERHGPGLKAAVGAAPGDERLEELIFREAAAAIAASAQIWPFIQFSAHSEPADDGWRRAASFEGAVVQAAVSALGGDIRDMLRGLLPGGDGALSLGRPGGAADAKTSQPAG